MAVPLSASKAPTSIFSVMSRLARKHDAVNLGQGFPDFEPDQALTARLAYHAANGRNQYAPLAGVGRLLKAIAEKVKHTQGVTLDSATEINITSGATQAIWTTIQAVVRPGDEVIIFEPAYDSYAPAVRAKGGVVVPMPLLEPDFHPDWAGFAERLNDRTRLVIINNPHNPTGKCWPREDLAELERQLKPTNALLLSDEVYELIVFDGHQHVSAIQFPGLRERAFVTGSFGKTFHVTGWKVGFVLAHPILMQHFRAVHQFTVFAVNTPAQHAIADHLASPKHYEALPRFFEQKRNRLRAALEHTGFRWLGSEGSYFALLDYSKLSDAPDTRFAERLITEYGVATVPISPFYTEPVAGQRLIRVCFAKREETLDAAAARLQQVVAYNPIAV